MESTGVYWIPLFELLDSEGFEVRLTDTRQLSRVPGRKSDRLDGQWIQLLHRCGLLQGCFRPADALCQWRSLERAKAALVAERSDWLRRMQKALDQMNVCVHQAVSDIDGTTGMAIVRAIIAGERDPRCRQSEQQIAGHLTGHWRPEHLFNLVVRAPFAAAVAANGDSLQQGGTLSHGAAPRLMGVPDGCYWPAVID